MPTAFLSAVAKEVIPGKIGWRWAVVVWLTIITASFGWQITSLNSEVTGLKESIVCSNLKSDIQDNRTALYEINRDIEMLEMEGTEVPESMRVRRQELMDTLEDNQTTYEALECPTKLA